MSLTAAETYLSPHWRNNMDPSWLIIIPCIVLVIATEWAIDWNKEHLSDMDYLLGDK